MKSKLIAMLLAATAAGGAQSVRVVPDMAIAESEYREAQEAWLRNDPNLEQDLNSRGREEMRTRIHRAAGLRDDVMAKKEVYLRFLVSHFEETRTRLASPGSGGFPVEQIRRTLEREQARLLAEEERLEALVQELPKGDEYLFRRRAMEEQMNDLMAAQNNIALRMRSLERTAASQRASADPAAGKALEEKLDEIGRMWADERERAVRERSSWARYYKDLEDLLQSPDIPRQGAPGRQPSKRRRGHDASAPALAASQPGTLPARQRTLDGVWSYESQPGARTGFGEPESVRLKLKRTGTDIEGTYVARLPGLHDTRQLNLALRGRLVSEREAKVQWVSQQPAAHGEMELKLGSDGRLLVQRLSSDDSYIPTGMEVLLPR